jgi:DNA-binding XRE family transcriptional regulator
MEDENVHQRLEELMRKLGHNKNSFSVTVGVASSVIHNIIDGRLGKRNKPSTELLVRICNAFPEVNLNWLIMGKGEMLNLNGGNIKNAIQVNQEADNEMIGTNLENTYQKNVQGKNLVAALSESEWTKKYTQLQQKNEKLEEKLERLQERYEHLQDKYVQLLEKKNRD